MLSMRVFSLRSPPTVISHAQLVARVRDWHALAVLPQVPIEKPRSEPTMSIFINMSGPLPVSVAPRTAAYLALFYHVAFQTRRRNPRSRYSPGRRPSFDEKALSSDLIIVSGLSFPGAMMVFVILGMGL
jgi:hypothetical protein